MSLALNSLQKGIKPLERAINVYAKEVFASSIEFLPYTKQLLKRLEENNT